MDGAGSWGRLVDTVANKSVDFGLTGFSQTIERFDKVKPIKVLFIKTRPFVNYAHISEHVYILLDTELVNRGTIIVGLMYKGGNKRKKTDIIERYSFLSPCSILLNTQDNHS